MTDRIGAARALVLWSDALKYNAENEGELTEKGMRELRASVIEAAQHLVDADKLIESSRAAFYDPANLPENVLLFKRKS